MSQKPHKPYYSRTSANWSRFSFPWKVELQGFYCRLITRTVGRSTKLHGYFIHDYGRKLHALLGQTTNNIVEVAL